LGAERYTPSTAAVAEQPVVRNYGLTVEVGRLAGQLMIHRKGLGTPPLKLGARVFVGRVGAEPIHGIERQAGIGRVA